MTTGIKHSLITIAKNLDIAATDALHFIANVEKKSPAAVAALGVVLGAISKAIADVQSGAENPAQALDVSFDSATFADLKAVWPDLVAFSATLGIKL